MNKPATIDDIFKKVAKGGAFFSVGSLAALLIQFIFGILIVRYLPPSEFGLISLSYTLMQILVTISVLGLNSGVPCFIGKYRGGQNVTMVSNISGSALVTVVILSTIFTILVIFNSSFIAFLFRKPYITQVLKHFALMLLPLATIQALTAIFRGWGDAKAKPLFQDVSPNLMRLLLLSIVILAGLGLQEVLWSYIISAWVGLIFYLIYAYFQLFRNVKPRFCIKSEKKLILFSLPLLGANIVTNITNWAGTMALGGLHSSEMVALFNTPHRLTEVIPVPLMAIVFLYLPEITQLTERGDTEKIKELYISATKWSYFLTLPFVLYFLMDAEFIVIGLFGIKYLGSANVLRVMAVGLSIHTLLGPNGMTLVAYGDNRTIFWGAMVASIFAIILCIIMVPSYGALGAAIGVALARAISNVFVSSVLYRRYRIHPFTSQYTRPLFFIGAISIPIYLTFSRMKKAISITHYCIFFIVSTIVLLAPLITRTLTKSDFELIKAVECRLTGKSRFTSKIFNFR